VLLITPESLEALLLRRPREVGRIFKALLFTVIDEVHVFMGSDRGSQLVCQLARIEKAVTEYTQAIVTESAPIPSVRRIGLSATLGDYDGGRRWLSQGTGLGTVLAGGGDSGKELSLALDYHNIPAGKDKGEAFYRSLYGQCRNKRVIIFTNSRLEAEECAASLNNLSHAPGAPCFFQVHHGSVSALLRDEA
jgi:ATP-dependent Lhr-like helicase